MKNKSKLIFIFLLLLFCFQSVVYSAFTTTMSVDGSAVARVESDVRITDFSVYESVGGAISSYEEFSKDTVLSNITLNSSSSITFKVVVVNYGSTEVCITDITGLPSGLSYELIDYTLNDRLCDDSGKCSNYAIKTFYIKVTGNSGQYDLNLLFTFDIKSIVSVTYQNITNNGYPVEVNYNDDLEVSIGYSNAVGVVVYQGGILYDDYTYLNGVLTVKNVVDDIVVRGFSLTINFDYTGKVQIYDVVYPGLYKLETWGAQGGCNLEPGNVDQYCGYGGYSVGNMNITETTLYVYVGGQGSLGSNLKGGYNGGGDCGYAGMTGGGATHIATVEGTLNYLESYKNSKDLLIVAGGGGGADVFSGGSGGGFKGGTAGTDGYHTPGEGGTQSAGGAGINNGVFGQGGKASYIDTDGSGAGGGGYYGGGSGKVGDWSSGGGGSGYIGNASMISKHMTCFKCETSTATATKTQSTDNVSSTAIADYAKSGDGYAKITLLQMQKY